MISPVPLVDEFKAMIRKSVLEVRAQTPPFVSDDIIVDTLIDGIIRQGELHPKGVLSKRTLRYVRQYAMDVLEGKE